MGGLARTMRYHYSLRLRTRLSYRERLICCTATSGAWRGSGSCVCAALLGWLGVSDALLLLSVCHRSRVYGLHYVGLCLVSY